MTPLKPGRPWTGRELSKIIGLAFLALTFALALGRGLPLPELLPQQDKWEHLAAFLALGLFFGLGASARGLIACGLVLAATAVGIEALQGAVTTTREASWADAFTSLAGLSGGLAAAMAANAAPGWVGRVVSPARRPAL